MFENPRRGRQARNFTTKVPKILVLKSSSEQIETAKSVKSLGLNVNATNQIRMKIYSVHIQTAWVETKTVKK